MTTNYVIIGGDAAGMSAAMEIVRRDKEAKITVLEKTNVYSYGQCGLPYVIDGRVASTDDLIARSVQAFREKYGIDARTNAEVTHIDMKKQIVAGADFTVNYDKLLIATGAAPVIPNDWKNATIAGIHTVKTIAQLHELQRQSTTSKKVVVIGGGYIGLEMADVLRNAGKDVAIIQRSNQLAPMLNGHMAKHVYSAAEQHGVAIYLNTAVQGFTGDTHVTGVVTDQGIIEADLVIAAVGVKPSTQFLSETPLHFLPNGACLVDAHMATNVPNVYAAGDCAAHYNIMKGAYDYVPLGTTANKQGRIAGITMAGQYAAFKGIVGTSILQFFNIVIGSTGLNERTATAAQLAYDVHTFQANHIAGYYEGVKPLYITMLVEKYTERVLGAQIVGESGVDKRIDVLATSLMYGATLQDLIDLDLSYAPPFNGVWDAIQQLAKRHSH